jgi:hypothetical protein
MKRFFLFLILLLFSFSSIVSAHGPDAITFLKIENKETKPYFLEDVGILTSELIIPKDMFEDTLLMGEEIFFEIDVHKLEERFPDEDFSKIKFNWDFGDGVKKEGVKQVHTYKKPGSYFLNIKSSKEELSESVLIQVIPDKDYKIPQAVIKVNDKKGTNENYNILDLDLNNALSFDASGTVPGTAKIVKYTWDFGDDKSEEGKTVKHQYQLPQAFATVVLRVEDENGIFSDAFVNLRNSGSNEPNRPQVQGIAMIAGPVLIAILVAIVGIFYRRRRKK